MRSWWHIALPTHAAIQALADARRKASTEVNLGFEQIKLDQRLAELRAEVEATVARAEAVSPDLIAALQAFSDRAMVAQVSQSMAPLAILGGKSVQDVVAGLLKGTSLEKVASS